MTVADRQQEMIERALILPDPQERLAMLMQRAGKVSPLPDSDRIPENLVPGCISQVWLTRNFDHGLCHFRSDSSSPMLKGLSHAIAQIYDRSPPAEIIATPPVLLRQLGIDSILTPTRLNGLENIYRMIQVFAKAVSGSAESPCG